MRDGLQLSFVWRSTTMRTTDDNTVCKKCTGWVRCVLSHHIHTHNVLMGWCISQLAVQFSLPRANLIRKLRVALFSFILHRRPLRFSDGRRGWWRSIIYEETILGAFNAVASDFHIALFITFLYPHLLLLHPSISLLSLLSHTDENLQLTIASQIAVSQWRCTGYKAIMLTREKKKVKHWSLAKEPFNGQRKRGRKVAHAMMANLKTRSWPR